MYVGHEDWGYMPYSGRIARENNRSGQGIRFRYRRGRRDNVTRHGVEIARARTTPGGFITCASRSS